jgi:putative ABC transport system substrate-binding protein
MTTGIMAKTKRQCVNKSAVFLLYAFVLILVFSISRDIFADSTQNVVIITSSNSNFQRQTAARIREKLEANGAMAIIISTEDFISSSQNVKTLYVAIGEYAINSLHEFDSDAFVLRISSRIIPGTKYTSAQSDLITAQPDCRHIHLIKSINPKWSTVGVLSSVGSLDIAAALTKCAIRQNLNLRVYAITDKTDLLVTLEAAIEDNKVLLAISDPLIYNTDTVKNILLTAYRHRKPVIGYSDSFVQAGAIAAIYTSAESVGDKVATIISGFFSNNWQFNQDIYATGDFSISTNTQVATSLEITLPSKESIQDNIMWMEKRP